MSRIISTLAIYLLLASARADEPQMRFPISPALDKAINVSATVPEGEAQVIKRLENADGIAVHVLVPVTVHLPGSDHTYAGHFTQAKKPSIGRDGAGRLDLDVIDRVEFKAVVSEEGPAYSMSIVDSIVAVPMKVQIGKRDVVGSYRFAVGSSKYRIRADLQSDTARVQLDR